MIWRIARNTKYSHYLPLKWHLGCNGWLAWRNLSWLLLPLALLSCTTFSNRSKHLAAYTGIPVNVNYKWRERKCRGVMADVQWLGVPVIAAGLPRRKYNVLFRILRLAAFVAGIRSGPSSADLTGVAYINSGRLACLLRVPVW